MFLYNNYWLFYLFSLLFPTCQHSSLLITFSLLFPTSHTCSYIFPDFTTLPYFEDHFPSLTMQLTLLYTNLTYFNRFRSSLKRLLNDIKLSTSIKAFSLDETTAVRGIYGHSVALGYNVKSLSACFFIYLLVDGIKTHSRPLSLGIQGKDPYLWFWYLVTSAFHLKLTNTTLVCHLRKI